MDHDARVNSIKTILPSNNSACFHAVHETFTKPIRNGGHYFIFRGLESFTRTSFGRAMVHRRGHGPCHMGHIPSDRITGDSRVQFLTSIHSKNHPLSEISFLISARLFARNSNFFVQNFFFRFDHKFHHKNPV